ncbi:MAG: class I SAM-dependent methyltransferase [Actinomycetota bacterium]
MFEPRDAPYPELKKTHTMAHVGRPFTDFKPPPAAPVWAAIEGLGRFHVLCAALELDVFDALGRLGPSTIAEINAELGCSEAHLETLLDSVVAMGLLDQVDGTYELNDTAKRYLVSDGPATMADLVPVAPGPHENWTRLADTVRHGRPATPIDDDPAGFYLPLVEGTFTTMFRCATRSDFKLRWSAMRSPRVLDLGAGGAPWAIAILAGNDGATAVINDLDGVIDVAERKVAEHGLTGRVELRPGDFHEIPIEDGDYDIVVLGHVCRTEGPELAQRLIARAFDALRPEGRLILADYFVDPERKMNPHAVLMGATMMASTVNGNGFTTDDYAGWVRSAGFADVRLIESIGFQQQLVATRKG